MVTFSSAAGIHHIFSSKLLRRHHSSVQHAGLWQISRAPELGPVPALEKDTVQCPDGPTGSKAGKSRPMDANCVTMCRLLINQPPLWGLDLWHDRTSGKMAPCNHEQPPRKSLFGRTPPHSRQTTSWAAKLMKNPE